MVRATKLLESARVHLCPKCGGQGFVNKPPWVAGDQHEWLSNNTGGYLCPVCKGHRYVRV